MFNFNIFESLYLSCFCYRDKQDKQDELDKNIINICKEYHITILPITSNVDVDIDNLYPVTDHVELWNIFIIGNDKTYILAKVNDKHINIPNIDKLLNRKAENLLPDELRKIFDKIWDKTLSGKQLQFYMVWNNKLYFINTYPFFNGKGKIIGAILFMRTFESVPNINQSPRIRVSLDKIRVSLDKHRISLDEPNTTNTRSKHSFMLEDSTNSARNAARYG